MKTTPGKRNRPSDNGKSEPSRLNWDDARVFLGIARAGTLSAAANTLGLGIATVSRRLERLEAALGVALFTRHQSGYQATDEGAALIARAEALEQAGEAFGAAAQGLGEVTGCVRLATAENLANPLIIPSLDTLYAGHPELRLEVLTGIQTVNLHRRDADLAIRMVRPERGNVTLRRLGVLGFGLYGSPEYVQRRRHAKAGADMARFDGDDFIGWTDLHPRFPAAQWLDRTLGGRACRITTSTLANQIAAAGAGLGLAVLPHFLARRAGLVCVHAELGADQPIWLVIHSDLVHSRRVRVVADHLTQVFLEHGPALRGEI
ncbi:LysR family transcriptional regulator [Modicisalibacter radicis]|uniref:LysR family transcriptional regulator n=1 Tax=Halomonas sp. EAR18 TaxID=2518972 RepID=UPI00109D3054|nr:LysR family transcriptional regulator [Halomonas sp. EAR18]